MDYLQRTNSPESAFSKALKVIYSCENAYHTKAARKYVNLFFNAYCTNSSISSGLRLYKPSTKIANMYNTLLSDLIKTENRFENA